MRHGPRNFGLHLQIQGIEKLGRYQAHLEVDQHVKLGLKILVLCF